MIRSKLYPYPSPDRRKTDRQIVLAHVSDFVLKTHPFPPDLRNRTSYHSLPELRDYYRERVEMRHFPFHYYCNLIKNDWEIQLTAPQDLRSPILHEASEQYYVDPRYKDAVIICVQDNYALNTPDPRTWQVLAYEVIAPLCRQFGVNFRDSVSWFDEIWNWDKYERDQKENPLDWSYRWEVNKMLYFDRTVFNLETIKFL